MYDVPNEKIINQITFDSYLWVNFICTFIRNSLTVTLKGGGGGKYDFPKDSNH